MLHGLVAPVDVRHGDLQDVIDRTYSVLATGMPTGVDAGVPMDD